MAESTRGFSKVFGVSSGKVGGRGNVSCVFDSMALEGFAETFGIRSAEVEVSSSCCFEAKSTGFGEAIGVTSLEVVDSETTGGFVETVGTRSAEVRGRVTSMVPPREFQTKLCPFSFSHGASISVGHVVDCIEDCCKGCGVCCGGCGDWQATGGPGWALGKIRQGPTAGIGKLNGIRDLPFNIQ